MLDITSKMHYLIRCLINVCLLAFAFNQLTAFTLPKCGVSKIPHWRIIGGVEAKQGEFPWQVAILDDYGFQYCGGTIIGDQWVLTATHCDPNVKRDMVFVGEINLKKIKNHLVQIEKVNIFLLISCFKYIVCKFSFIFINVLNLKNNFFIALILLKHNKYLLHLN